MNTEVETVAKAIVCVDQSHSGFTAIASDAIDETTNFVAFFHGICSAIIECVVCGTVSAGVSFKSDAPFFAMQLVVLLRTAEVVRVKGDVSPASVAKGRSHFLIHGQASVP